MTVRAGRWLLVACACLGVACAHDADRGSDVPEVGLDAQVELDGGASVALDAAPAVDSTASFVDASDPLDAAGGLVDAAGSAADSGEASDAQANALDASGDSGLDAAESDATMTNDADAALEPLPAIDELPWPTQQPALLPCTPSGFDFDSPPLAQSGQLAIELSAPLQPSGFDVRVNVRVLDDSAQLDSSYSGTLLWQLPQDVHVVEDSPVMAGQASARLRFGVPGVALLQVGLTDDARVGQRELQVYAPQLPVWELTVDPDDLQRIVDDPEGRELIAASLRIDGVDHATLMRLHGGSSRYYEKKSFRFDLLDAPAGTYGTHLILRAEFNDKTLLRNWLGMQLFNTGTWLPAPRAQFVHFRINGDYYGVMNNVERIDGSFIKARGLSSTASLYEADPPLPLAALGNLAPLDDPTLYRMVYVRQRGIIDYTDLITLIEQTLVVPDDDFERAAREEIAVDDYLVYLAMMAAIQNQDDVRKNYYLYRDFAAAPPDHTWVVLPWDLDLTFGHLWSEEYDVLDESIVSDSDLFVGVHVPERGGFYNQLADRVLRTGSFRTRFRAMLDRIMADCVTRENVKRLVDNALCRATPDIVADNRKRASNAEYLARVAEIYTYIEGRAAYVQSVGEPSF